MTHCFPECYDEMLTKTLTDCGLNYLDLYLVRTYLGLVLVSPFSRTTSPKLNADTLALFLE